MESITVRTVPSTENTSSDRKPILVDEPVEEQRSQPFPRNDKLLGAASLLNDIASEMILPLMPQFRIPAATVHRYGEGPGANFRTRLAMIRSLK